MSGMNRDTGRAMDEDAHIRQSVGDILTTPIGSRTECREYGSLNADLIDHPGSPANRMRLMSSSTMALIRWEPRLSVQRINIDLDMNGEVTADVYAVRRTGPRAGIPINIAIPLR